MHSRGGSAPFNGLQPNSLYDVYTPHPSPKRTWLKPWPWILNLQQKWIEKYFFLCSTLIDNKTFQMVGQHEGMDLEWRGGAHTSYRWPALGVIWDSEWKGPRCQLERRRSKEVWLTVPLLVRNEMRNKREAAEECRLPKHWIILDSTKLQGQESGG